MSENTNETNRPTHAIYHVSGDGDKARWTKIGAAWGHQDGKGSSIVLDALPLTSRLVMREIINDLENSDNGGQQ